MSRPLWFILLIVGIALRAYWSLANGLSLDEITSLAYVAEPSWASAFWDNAPPTFYVFGKLLAGGGEFALRGFAFVLSSAGFVIFLRWLDRAGATLGTQVFWALNPVSIVNANFRPTVFAELCGILLFIAVERCVRGLDGRKKSFATIGASASALAATTYLGPLGWFVAASRLRTKVSKRARILLGVAILIIAVAEVSYIRTTSLVWLRGSDFGSSLLASVRGASQFFGYSFPLFIAIVAFAAYKRLLDMTTLALGFVAIVMPSLFGYQMEQARFLIFLNPYAVMLVDRVFTIQPGSKVRTVTVLVISSYVLAWFLTHEKSAWREAVNEVQKSGASVFVTTPRPAATHLGAIALDDRYLPDFQLNCPQGCWVLTSRYSAWTVLDEKQVGSDFRDFSIAEKREYGERCLDPVAAYRLVPKDHR